MGNSSRQHAGSADPWPGNLNDEIGGEVSTAAATTRSGEGARNKWLVLIAMTGTLSMIMLDATVVSVALPSIQASLDLTQTQVQWVVNAYLLSLAALVAFGGRLADIFNRVHVLVVGIVIFTIASATAGLAQDEVMIIASRAVQGFGAALMMPPSQTLALNAFPASERGKAMGIYAGVSSVFLSLGPLIGGAFTEVSWRWVFLINLPLGVLTLLMVFRSRPDGRVASAQRMDWPGAFTLVPGLVAIVLALMQSTTWGWSSPLTIGLLVAGALLVLAFIAIELGVNEPLIELRLFASRNFSADTAVLALVFFGLMGITVFGAIYVQDMLGFSPIEAGLSMLPLTLPLLIMAPLSGRLYDKIGPRALTTVGASLVAMGFVWTAAFLDEFDYTILVPAYVVMGVGLGLVMSPTNTDALNTAPAQHRGQASGVISTARQVGSTFGIAIGGTIVATISNNRIVSFLEGEGESPEQAESLERVLAESEGSQAAITGSIPAAEQEAILNATRDGITDGIAGAYWVSAGVVFLAAIIAVVFLRREHAADEEGGSPSGPALG